MSCCQWTGHRRWMSGSGLLVLNWRRIVIILISHCFWLCILDYDDDFVKILRTTPKNWFYHLLLSNLYFLMSVNWWIRFSRSLISSKTSARWHEERWDHRKRTDSLEEEDRSDGSLEPQKVSRSTLQYCLALITISMITKAGRTPDQMKCCVTKGSESNKTISLQGFLLQMCVLFNLWLA